MELKKIELKKTPELNKTNCKELEWELELIEWNLPQSLSICDVMLNAINFSQQE